MDYVFSVEFKNSSLSPRSQRFVPMSFEVFGHDWSNLAAAAVASEVYNYCIWILSIVTLLNSFTYLKYNLFIFHWRIIALQNFTGFCQTSTWIRHRYTYNPSLLNLLLPISLPIPTPQADTPLSFLSRTANSHWLSILHMVV